MTRSPHRREARRAGTVAKEAGARCLASASRSPGVITAARRVGHLVLAGVSRDENRVTAYHIEAGLPLRHSQLAGCTGIVHTPRPRLHDASAGLHFGGQTRGGPARA
ncbi:hypothetical protein RB628_34765 [Streptomyces sp. ADMS]|uniref:hypothetical protein n=1 Tax=Streptomyces sp. ADMS TaxID=3071415 RepID=UPI00296FEE56|nr:hypothetical protein [Streptomyces sp. ADMS]MDW4910354.1 hypothetical protein [Streptomyces sp. ADMS]